MVVREQKHRLAWQSKAVLLLVLPWTAANVVLQSHWWFLQVPQVAWQTLGISGAFGLVVWLMRAGTAGAACTGAILSASLIFSSTSYPYEWSWMHGALAPLLAVFLLTWAATKIGHAKKVRLGTAESKRGRNAAQVAANLGVAALVGLPAQAIAPGSNLVHALTAYAALAALAEAAADTVSSEIGQVFGGQPRLMTTLRPVEPGTDGGVTLSGTVAGMLAACVVVTVGFLAMRGGEHRIGFWVSVCLCTGGATLGLLFDSLLGATLERKGWLNNDAVNFLSTVSAVAFFVLLMALLPVLP